MSGPDARFHMPCGQQACKSHPGWRFMGKSVARVDVVNVMFVHRPSSIAEGYSVQSIDTSIVHDALAAANVTRGVPWFLIHFNANQYHNEVKCDKPDASTCCTCPVAVVWCVCHTACCTTLSVHHCTPGPCHALPAVLHRRTREDATTSCYNVTS